MVSYSIHVIVEYNQAGSEIICRQMIVLYSLYCAEHVQLLPFAKNSSVVTLKCLYQLNECTLGRPYEINCSFTSCGASSARVITRVLLQCKWFYYRKNQCRIEFLPSIFTSNSK